LCLRIRESELRIVDVTGEVHTILDAQFAGERLQAGIAFAASDQQQADVGRLRKRTKQHIEAFVIAQAADGEHAQSTAGPFHGAGRSIFCGNFHFFQRAKPERNNVGFGMPRCKCGTRVAIRCRCGHDGLRASQQRLLEVAVETIHCPHRRAADIERHVGMPMHDPGQAPRRRREQSPERRRIRQMQMQQIWFELADQTRE